MPRLIALALPGGARFLDELQRAWDRGDAVVPVDPRLPPPAVADLLDVMRPALLIDEHGSMKWADPQPVEAGDALVVATSGTTGAPKGVVLTHAAVRASATATSQRLGVTADDVWLACLPLSHVGGLSVVTRALVTGTRLIVQRTFDAECAMNAQATLVSLVPTALARVDPNRWRIIVLGGATAPEIRPPNVVTTYGLTESGSGVVYDGVPLDGVEIRVEPDGRIALRGPMLLRQYRDGHDPKDSHGWLVTHDAGAINGDGGLVVFGRVDDMIVTGGEKVWPNAVEAAIRTVPGVREVAVIGRPDPVWGQRVVAYVVPSGEPPALEIIRAHVKRSLPAYCAPRQLFVVADLPLTSVGKVKKRDLHQ